MVQDGALSGLNPMQVWVVCIGGISGGSFWLLFFLVFGFFWVFPGFLGVVGIKRAPALGGQGPFQDPEEWG